MPLNSDSWDPAACASLIVRDSNLQIIKAKMVERRWAFNIDICTANCCLIVPQTNTPHLIKWKTKRDQSEQKKGFLIVAQSLCFPPESGDGSNTTSPEGDKSSGEVVPSSVGGFTIERTRL